MAPSGNIFRIFLASVCHAVPMTPSRKRGRQFVHAWPYLPGDSRIQSGLRVDSEVLCVVCWKNLLRNSVPIWRSANDIITSAGRIGSIPPTHIVQLIGILPNYQC
eukprot:4275223-Pyramimonas_sp.AAC.1